MKKIVAYISIVIAACAVITGCLPEKAETALTYKGPTVVEIKNQTLGQIDTILNRKGVHSCTTQNDSSRTVNQDAIVFKQKAIAAVVGPPAVAAVAAVTLNTLSCVTAEDGTNPAVTPTYRLKANSALAANARGVDTIWVQLVGPQVSTPTVINFSVRPSTASVNPSTAVEGVNYDFIPVGARTVTIPANRSVGYILTTVKPGVLTTAGTSVRISIDLLGNGTVNANPNYNKFFLTIRKN